MPGAGEITILVALDRPHFEELRWSIKTWLKHRHEMIACSWLFVVDCDEATLADWATALLAIVPHARIVPVVNVLPSEVVRLCRTVVGQREKMLSALMYAVMFVQTPWFAKIDADAISLERGPFWKNEWFDGDPAFVANPWGYTKPANALEILDNWGDLVPSIHEFPRLNIPFDPNARLVRSKRIISWLYFGRTDWHRRLAKLCRDYGPECGRLPVSSQDTTCWWYAERTKAFYRRVNMKRLGWAHVNGIGKLKEIAGRAR